MNDFPRWHEYFPAWHQPSFCDGFCLSQPPFVTYFSRVCKRNISITTGLTSTANHSKCNKGRRIWNDIVRASDKMQGNEWDEKMPFKWRNCACPILQKNWFEDLLDWTTLVLTKKCNEKKLAKFVVFKKERRVLKWVSFSKKSDEFEVRLSFSQKVWEVSSRLEIEGNSLHPLEFFERLTAEYFFPLFGFFRKAAVAEQYPIFYLETCSLAYFKWFPNKTICRNIKPKLQTLHLRTS